MIDLPQCQRASMHAPRESFFTHSNNCSDVVVSLVKSSLAASPSEDSIMAECGLQAIGTHSRFINLEMKGADRPAGSIPVCGS